MAFNIAAISDRAREILGKSISSDEAANIMNSTGGGDEGQVIQFLRNQANLDPNRALKLVEESFKKRQDERNKIVGEFQAKNPFAYDQVLAQKMTLAKEQLDPYYNQTLNDYLQGVERQRTRTVEDQQRLLGELNQDVNSYTQTEQGNLQIALQKAGEGQAQAGLYESGLAQREQGLTQRESGLKMQDFLTQANRTGERYNLTANRNLSDIQREQTLNTRDIMREKEAQTRLLAEQQAKEAGTKYGYALRQALGPLADENAQGDVLTGLGI